MNISGFVDAPRYDAATAARFREQGYWNDDTLETVLAKWSASEPDRIAVIHGSRRITFGELHLSSRRMANGLIDLGLRKGDVVAIQMPNLPEFLVAYLGVALMGPQSIHARDHSEVEGIDIVLALDLSLSMQAADIKPNRFHATQEVVNAFVARRPNDRIGAVVFGRDAYTLLPLTTDHDALRTLIKDLELGMIEGRGTAIGNALGVALNRLRPSQAKSKVVILATDGDSNSGNVSPAQAAEFAKTLGVKVYTILMGRSQDAPVQSGIDLLGRAKFKRGNFPINPALLENVASTTGGEAFEATNREGLERSFHTILDQLERSEIEDAGRVYGELFGLLVIPALLLLFLELLVDALILRRWP